MPSTRKGSVVHSESAGHFGSTNGPHLPLPLSQGRELGGQLAGRSSVQGVLTSTDDACPLLRTPLTPSPRQLPVLKQLRGV